MPMTASARTARQRKTTVTGAEWVADGDATRCTNCSASFGIFTRRHHCRVCGQIFCGPCSSSLAALPASEKQQRVCAACAGVVGELAGRSPTEEEGESAVMGMHIRTMHSADDCAAALVDAVLADARGVLECLPSHALSTDVRPHAELRFAVELPSAALWEATMARLLRAGRWAFEGHGEVLRRAGQPLGKLVPSMARAAARARPRINFREGTSCFAVGEAVRVYDAASGEWEPDGEVADVRSADAAASGGPMPPGSVKVRFNRRRSTRWLSAGQAERYLRRASEGGLSGTVDDLIGTPTPESSEPLAAEGRELLIPNNVSTRVGGVYHETLAVRFPPGESHPSIGSFVGTCVLHAEGDERQGELLTSCLVQVFGEGGEGAGARPTFLLGRHGRADTPAKARQLFRLVELALARRRWPERPLRVRVCSLLNALVVDGRERAFFQNQLSALTEHAGERRPESNGSETFDFPSAMQELGADYACLNFVANWPLCLRLGSGPPAGRHNALHARGLRRHLRWLAQDVLQALSSMPSDWATSCVQEQLEPLEALAAGDCSSLDPWREGLPAVRAAVDLLRPWAATSGAAARQACSRLFMACELLKQLSRCLGTSFRRRAGELLQLCVLEELLGVVPFFNCKSGIDRTGLCVALWTTFHQLVSSMHPQVWIWHYLAMTYPVIIKIVHGLHDCGTDDGQGHRSLPLQQLREGCCLEGAASLLPFPPELGGEDEERQLYAQVERLCALCAGNETTLASGVFPAGALAAGGAERLAYLALERLFFAGPEAVLPQLQAGFFANVFGAATKVAAASTGVHGLKYGDSSGQPNSLAAQFMPKAVSCPERGVSVAITEVRKALLSREVAFATDILPYLIGASCGRGT